jgi:hypothetical protein
MEQQATLRPLDALQLLSSQQLRHMAMRIRAGLDAGTRGAYRAEPDDAGDVADGDDE